MRIVDLPSDFSFPDRQGFTLDAIVLHTTQGADSRTWLTKTGGVSANDLIRNEGGEAVIYRLVDEDQPAFHAGSVVGIPTTPLYASHGYANPNLWTFGIEIEGYAAGPVDPLLVEAVVWRIHDLRSRRGFLPLLNHAELSPGNRTDPGIWRSAIDKALEESVTDEEFIEKTRRIITPTLDAMKDVLAELAAGNRVEDQRIADVTARLDKLRTI